MKSAVKAFAFMLLVSQGSVKKLDAQTSEMQADRARRDTEIRWPAAYDPSVAPVFSHNELLIHADCHRVFARLSDAHCVAKLACDRQRCFQRDAAENGQGGSLQSEDLSTARFSPAS